MEDEILFNEIILQDIENSGDYSLQNIENQEQDLFSNSIINTSDSFTCDFSQDSKEFLTTNFSYIYCSLIIILSFLLAFFLYIFTHNAFVNNSDLK